MAHGHHAWGRREGRRRRRLGAQGLKVEGAYLAGKTFGKPALAVECLGAAADAAAVLMVLLMRWLGSLGQAQRQLQLAAAS